MWRLYCPKDIRKEIPMNALVRNGTTTAVCRHCKAPLSTVMVDLGAQPVSNDYLRPEAELSPEPYYPLRVYVCDTCKLAQLQDFFKGDDLFRDDYAYFSSVSTSWVAHAKAYTEMMTARFGLDGSSLAVEVASNDGYLLQHYKNAGIPVHGVEPCLSVAQAAIDTHGIPTDVVFFGVETAKQMVARGLSADVTSANNVLAHVPDINDFAGGFATLLKPQGVSTFEFPHLMRQIERTQFDTVYHEHFSYLSIIALDRVFESVGMRIFDVEELSSHGGSLRLFVCRKDADHPTSPRVAEVRDAEIAFGLAGTEVYENFSKSVLKVKRELIAMLADLKAQGAKIVGYGAAAKGNTLLNYANAGRDLLDYIADASPAKQNMFAPGTRETRPDYVVILPWNLEKEISTQLSFIREWGGKFIVPIPLPKII
jgi:hypothetical protein